MSFKSVLLGLAVAALVAAWPSGDIGIPLGGPALAQTSVQSGVLGPESDSDLWRRVRRADSFTLGGTAMGSPILVQSNGEGWRAAHNGFIARYGGYLVLLTLAVIVVFASVRGPIMIKGGRSGRTLKRFTQAQRTIHWFVAVTFILLAMSGMILLFGKYLLAPVIGQQAFAVVASASMQGHNLFGPLFIFALLAMIATYVGDNLLKAVDFVWLAKGGLFTGAHVSSWKFNMGEKLFFWLVVVAGLVISISGVVLDFPMLAETLDQLRLASLVHGAAALLLILPALFHIYLGTVGVEGALEGMTAGEVDENWAREHHDLWAENAEPAGPELATAGEAAPAPQAAGE